MSEARNVDIWTRPVMLSSGLHGGLFIGWLVGVLTAHETFNDVIIGALILLLFALVISVVFYYKYMRTTELLSIKVSPDAPPPPAPLALPPVYSSTLSPDPVIMIEAPGAESVPSQGALDASQVSVVSNIGQRDFSDEVEDDASAPSSARNFMAGKAWRTSASDMILIGLHAEEPDNVLEEEKAMRRSSMFRPLLTTEVVYEDEELVAEDSKGSVSRTSVLQRFEGGNSGRRKTRMKSTARTSVVVVKEGKTNSAKFTVYSVTGGPKAKSPGYRLSRADSCIEALEAELQPFSEEELLAMMEAKLQAIEDSRVVVSAEERLRRWELVLSLLEKMRAPFPRCCVAARAMGEKESLMRLRAPLTEQERMQTSEAAIRAMGVTDLSSTVLSDEQKIAAAKASLEALMDVASPLSDEQRIAIADAMMAVRRNEMGALDRAVKAEAEIAAIKQYLTDHPEHRDRLDEFLQALKDCGYGSGALIKTLHERSKLAELGIANGLKCIAPLSKMEERVVKEAGLIALQTSGHELKTDEIIREYEDARRALMKLLGNITDYQRGAISEAVLEAIVSAPPGLSSETQVRVAEEMMRVISKSRPLTMADKASIMERGLRELIKCLKLTPTEALGIATTAKDELEKMYAPLGQTVLAERQEAAAIAFLQACEHDQARHERAHDAIMNLVSSNARTLAAEKRIEELEKENALLRQRLAELQGSMGSLVMVSSTDKGGQQVSVQELLKSLEDMMGLKAMRGCKSLDEAMQKIKAALDLIFEKLGIDCYISFESDDHVPEVDEDGNDVDRLLDDETPLEYQICSENSIALLYQQLGQTCMYTYNCFKSGMKNVVTNCPDDGRVYFWEGREGKAGDFAIFPCAQKTGFVIGCLGCDTLNRQTPKTMSAKELEMLETLAGMVAEGLREAAEEEDRRARHLTGLVNGFAQSWAERMLKMSDLQKERRRVQMLMRDGTAEHRKCVQEIKSYVRPARSIVAITTALLRLMTDVNVEHFDDEWIKLNAPLKWKTPVEPEKNWALWSKSVQPGLMRLIKNNMEYAMASTVIKGSRAVKAAKDVRSLLADISSWNFRGSFILKYVYPWVMSITSLIEITHSHEMAELQKRKRYEENQVSKGLMGDTLKFMALVDDAKAAKEDGRLVDPHPPTSAGTLGLEAALGIGGIGDGMMGARSSGAATPGMDGYPSWSRGSTSLDDIQATFPNTRINPDKILYDLTPEEPEPYDENEVKQAVTDVVGLRESVAVFKGHPKDSLTTMVDKMEAEHMAMGGKMTPVPGMDS